MRFLSRLLGRTRGRSLAGFIGLLLLIGIFPAPQPKAAVTHLPGSFSVYAYSCLPGSDSPEFDLTTCEASPLAGVQYTLTMTSGAVPHSDTRDNLGAKIWYGLPAGTASLAATLPQEFSGARAFCGAYLAPLASLLEVDVDASFIISFEMPADSPLQCNWYFLTQATPTDGDQPSTEGDTDTDQNGESTDPNVDQTNGQNEEQPADSGDLNGALIDTVTAHIYGCPPGFPTDSPADAIYAQCGELVHGAPLVLLDSQGLMYQGVVESEGTLTWLVSEPGTLELRPQFTGYESSDGSPEFIPVLAACATYPTGGAPIEYLLWNGQPIGSEYKVNLPVAANQSVDCVWYLAPNSAWLELSMYSCDDSFDPEGNIDVQRADDDLCQPLRDGRLLADYEDGSSVYGGTNSDGVWPWKGSPSGIVELIPDELGYVRCSVHPWELGRTGAFSEPLSRQERVEYDLAIGQALECEWYYVPVENSELPPDTNDDYGQIVIHKHVCGPGVSETGSFQALVEICSNTVSGAGFTFTNDVADVSPATTDDTGTVAWASIYPGTHTVSEQLEDTGYKAIAVYCTYYLEGSFPTGYEPQTLLGTATEPYITHGMDENYVLECRWFNAPTENGEQLPPDSENENAWSLTLTVYKYACTDGRPAPFSWDIEDVADAWAEECDPLDDVRFTLSAGAYAEDRTTDEDGVATWPDVQYTRSSAANGDIPSPALVEHVPDGYAYVVPYCGSAATMSVYSADEPVEIKLNPQRRQMSITCRIFNLPDGTASAPSSIHVAKYLCAELAGDAAETGAVHESCSPQEGISFTLVDAAGQETELTTDPEGRVQWSNPAEGEFAVIEGSMTETHTALVHCFTAHPRFGPARELEAPEILNSSFSYHVSHGSSAQCAVFNRPGDEAPPDDSADHGSVTIHKHTCGSGVTSETGYQDLLTTCSNSATGNNFTFTIALADSTSATTDQTGTVSWSPVPPGTVTLTEHLEDVPYRAIGVYCAYYPEGDFPTSYEPLELMGDPSAPYVTYDLGAGHALDCRWFNAPVENGDIGEYTPTATSTPTVNAGFEPGQDETATYTVEAPPDYTPTYTYTPEYTPTYTYTPEYTPTVPDYTPTYTPTYEESPDYTPTYTPTLTDGAPRPPTATYTATQVNGAPPSTATSTAVTVVIEGPTSTPSATPTAAIVIVKHLCEPGYEPTTEEADPAEDCDEEGEPVSFSLLEDDEEIDSETTDEEDDQQQVRFDDLEAGIYQIGEDQEAGIAIAFIGGCTSTLRTFGDYAFLPYAWVDADGRVTVQLLDGEELTCDWYNVPRAEGTVDVSIYVCPGRVANPARCDPAEDQMDVDLVPIEEGETISVTANDDGETSITAPAGAYQVDVDGEPACLVDSTSVDDDGNLVIEPGETVQATVYRCEGE